MLKFRIGTTWKFNSTIGPVVQTIVGITDDEYDIRLIQAPTNKFGLWDGLVSKHEIVDHITSNKSSYTFIQHHNTKLGRILYK